MPPRFDADDSATVLKCCERLDVEGIVLKDTTARYDAGKRTRALRKMKTSTWREVHNSRRMPAR